MRTHGTVRAPPAAAQRGPGPLRPPRRHCPPSPRAARRRCRSRVQPRAASKFRPPRLLRARAPSNQLSGHGPGWGDRRAAFTHRSECPFPARFADRRLNCRPLRCRHGRRARPSKQPTLVATACHCSSVRARATSAHPRMPRPAPRGPRRHESDLCRPAPQRPRPPVACRLPVPRIPARRRRTPPVASPLAGGH